MLKLRNIKKDYRLGTNCVHALKGIDITFRLVDLEAAGQATPGSSGAEER